MAEEVKVEFIGVDKVSKTTDSIGHSLGGLAKIAAVGVTAAFTAMAGATAFAIKEAVEAEEVTAALADSIKRAGGNVDKLLPVYDEWANSLQAITKFTDEEVKSAQALLINLAGISDNSGEVLEATLDLAEAMKIDLRSAALAVGKAMADPVRGMSLMARQGIIFSDSIETTVKQLTEQGKLAEAQAIILDALHDKFAGAAEAAGKTFAGQLTILQNQLSEVAEEVGTALMPALTDLLRTVSPLVIQFAREWLPRIIQVAQALGDQLGPALIFATGLLQQIAGFIRGIVLPALQSFFGETTEGGQRLKGILDILSKVFAVVLPIAVTVLGDVWKHALQPLFKTFASEILPKILPMLDALGNLLGIVLPPFIALLMRGLQALGDLFVRHIIPAAQRVIEVIGGIISIVTNAINLLAQLLSTAIPNISLPFVGGAVGPGGQGFGGGPEGQGARRGGVPETQGGPRSSTIVNNQGGTVVLGGAVTVERRGGRDYLLERKGLR